MKAIRFHSYGGPDVLQLDEIPMPTAKPGESLVRVVAAGVNYLDVYQRTGLYPNALPFGPGSEGVGVVEIGSATFKAGTRVAWAQNVGSYAQFAAIPDWKLIPVPDAIDDRTAAAVLLQGITAQLLCETTYAAKAGDIALVHAGAGGVGLLLIQLLKSKGVSVLTTVSTPVKAALAKEAGADDAILYTETDFAAAVNAATGGKGVHVVYDSVGKTTWAGSLSVLRPLGTLALFGQSSGAVPPIDPLALTKQGSVFLARPSIVHHIADADSLHQRANKVLNWVRDGKLKLRIEHGYPLADVAQAHRDLEARKTTGKLVIDVAV